MAPSAASSEAVPVRLDIAAAGEAPGGLEREFHPAGPGDDRPSEIGDRGAEVGVREFAARAQVEVSPNVGRADFALETPAIGHSLHQSGAELAIGDDCGCGGVGELEPVDVEMGRGQTQVEVEAPQRREREGLRAPVARRAEDPLGRSEQRFQRQRFGGERPGDGGAPAGFPDRDRALERLPGAGQRRVAEG